MNFNTGELIDVAALPSRIVAEMDQAHGQTSVTSITASAPFPDRANVERAMIENAIRTTNGNKRKAATILKMSRATLYNKIKKYQIEYGIEGSD